MPTPEFLVAALAPARVVHMSSHAFLSDAASCFFIAWMVIVVAVGIIAFGRDLLRRRPFSD
jgi:hypothetical protein